MATASPVPTSARSPGPSSWRSEAARSSPASPEYARSGLAARHGLTVVNSPGLIDEGYRGEIRVVLLNTDVRDPFVVEPGMRIAQLVVLPVPELDPVEVDELPETERGVRGFGSSMP